MNKRSVKGTSLNLKEIEKIINAYLDGMYNYETLNSVFCLSGACVANIFNNRELIEEYFGEEIYIKLKEKARIIQDLREYSNGKELIRDHEVRRIIKDDILYADASIKKSLYIIMLFLKYEGNLSLINEKTNINKNEIINILDNKMAKTILKPEVEVYFNNLFKIEKALHDRNLYIIENTIKRIIYMSKVLKYKDYTISFIIDIPIDTINRILVDPYTTIKCKNLVLSNITEEEIKKQKILDIYDVIINNNISVRATGKIFNLSGVTISNYMNNELEKIDTDKYNNIQNIFNEKNSHVITEKKLEKINIMKKMYDQGYTINEIGNELEKDPSTVYRNLITFFPEISSKMHINKINNINLTNKKNML